MFFWMEERKGTLILRHGAEKGAFCGRAGIPSRCGGRSLLFFPGGLDGRGRPYLEVEGLVAQAPPLLRSLWDSCHYAPSDAAVLLRGASGVGKEGFARLIHRLSHHRAGAFVSLNCASLPPGLAEAELFGHERGAFTGASESRSGLFEMASGGTLFLDEVGELPLAIQAKLLRVLETGEVRRIGSSRTRSVRVRILSATHRDLAEEVRHKRFRLDLLFRLGVLPLEIPPLSARLDDLPILVRRFLEELGVDIALTPEAQHRLRQHAWPGNVRELRNVLQRAVLCSKSRVIDAEHLIFGPASFDVGNAAAGSLHARMDEAILLELQRQGGHRRRTYEALRMPRSTFYRWLRRHRERLEGVAIPWGGEGYALREGLP